MRKAIVIVLDVGMESVSGVLVLAVSLFNLREFSFHIIEAGDFLIDGLQGVTVEFYLFLKLLISHLVVGFLINHLRSEAATHERLRGLIALHMIEV